jgi:hypothetical protein
MVLLAMRPSRGVRCADLENVPTIFWVIRLDDSFLMESSAMKHEESPPEVSIQLWPLKLLVRGKDAIHQFAPSLRLLLYALAGLILVVTVSKAFETVQHLLF